MPVQSRSLKYLDLAEKLRADVEAGHLKPGDRLPSFVELRNEHGISRGTVEKMHSVLERDGLIVREQGRGVFVASPKQPAATGILGFLGGGFDEAQSSLFWSHLLDSIRLGAGREDRQLLLLTETTNPEIWSKVDGLLLSVNEEQILPILRRVPSDMPCISLLTAADGVSSVVADDYRGARDATEYLLSLGHTRIAHLVSGSNHIVEHRLEGYRDALQAAGIEPTLFGVRQMHLRAEKDSKKEFAEQGRRTVTQWLQSNWKELGYTALLAQNDNAAIGAIEAFHDAGLRVPEDISVVGFDGNELYDFFKPRLTTVLVPVQEIGEAAVRMLLGKVGRPRSPVEKLVVPAYLRMGDSTAAPAT